MMRGGGPMPMMAFAGPAPMAMMDSVKGAPPSKAELAPVTHVRKLFPETWLWKSLETSYVKCLMSCFVIYLCSVPACVYFFFFNFVSNACAC